MINDPLSIKLHVFIKTFIMRILFFAMSLMLLAACSSLTEVTVNDKIVEVPRPPMMVKVDNNLFMDETEISNINYREYLYWVKMIYGNESKNYVTALPDTTVWRTEKGYNEPYVQVYFRHPAYNDYPVIGISYEQALNYAKWRSDRVFEQVLLQKEKITYVKQTVDNYFSIEKYYNGKIQGVQPDYTIPFPKYRLPTKTEWETAAKGSTNDNYGVNIENRNVKKAQKKAWKLFNVDYGSEQEYSITASVNSFLENDFGIYNMIGNVGEMVAEQGIAKGGSWQHSLVESKIYNDLTYEKPARWLGFRNVCEYRYWGN